MGTSPARPDIAPCVNAEQFEAMKARFRNVGDCLTDDQLLELADCYHDILRWRREVRRRHTALASQPGAVAESRSFATEPAGKSIWEEARDGIEAGPTPFPP